LLTIGFSILFTCEEQNDGLDISGQWKFIRKTTEVYLTSSVDQFVLNPFMDSVGSISIRGKYESDLTQLMAGYEDSLSAHVFFFYSGLPGFTGPHYISIIESDDTVTAEYIYDLRSEYGPDIRETFHPHSIEYSFNQATGIFELPHTVFYSDTGSGEVTIGGSIDYNTVHLSGGKSTLFMEGQSSYNPDEIDTLDFGDDGVLCAYFREQFWIDTLCGEWSLNGNELSYDLSNGRHREYTCSISQDTLILTEAEYCESEPVDENFIWIAEYPESITEECTEETFNFYRQ